MSLQKRRAKLRVFKSAKLQIALGGMVPREIRSTRHFCGGKVRHETPPSAHSLQTSVSDLETLVGSRSAPDAKQFWIVERIVEARLPYRALVANSKSSVEDIRVGKEEVQPESSASSVDAP